MRAISQNVTQEQIYALADYFTKQPFLAPKQTVDPTLVEKCASVHDEHCEQCHSDGGRNRDDDAAILSGQWMPYLRRQLDNIMAGRRPAPRTMQRRLRKLDRADIDALLHFYASRGNTE